MGELEAGPLASSENVLIASQAVEEYSSIEGEQAVSGNPRSSARIGAVGKALEKWICCGGMPLVRLSRYGVRSIGYQALASDEAL